MRRFGVLMLPRDGRRLAKNFSLSGARGSRGRMVNQKKVKGIAGSLAYRKKVLAMRANKEAALSAGTPKLTDPSTPKVTDVSTPKVTAADTASTSDEPETKRVRLGSTPTAEGANVPSPMSGLGLTGGLGLGAGRAGLGATAFTQPTTSGDAEAASGTTYSAVAMKLMAKMNYREGEGLGARGDGMVAPIVPVQRARNIGLGFADDEQEAGSFVVDDAESVVWLQSDNKDYPQVLAYIFQS